MYRKIVLLAFVWMLLVLATSGTPIVVPASASEHHVYSGQSIQEAINNATPGDTIFVHAGTYYEHIIVNKTVSLIGENWNTTIIDGNRTKTVIEVAADYVNVTSFTIQNGGGPPYCGIYLKNCIGNTISNNIIRNNAYGIELLESNGNSIIWNTIMNSSWAGIYISNSNENIFYDNIVANNSVGAWIASSTVPNTFYHNNLIDNPEQAHPFATTYWSNGTEGNYWSDYTGVDNDGDGIGETNTPHLGIDYYPLIIPTRPFPVIWDEVIYPVALFGNSTVSRFYFNQSSKEIGFYVTGLLNKTGFCNVTIPKKLLRDNPWTVKADNNPILFISSENATHSSLYFTYNHSASKIQIIGTEVIPEFPSGAFLPLSIIVMLLAATLRKRRRERHRHSSSKPKAIFHASPSYSGGKG